MVTVNQMYMIGWQILFCQDVNISPMNVYNVSNIFVDHNLRAANFGIANPLGTNTITTSLNFILPTANPLLADFHLESNNTAINAGTNNYAPITDKDGSVRFPQDSINIGCYEYQNSIGINHLSQNESSILLFPNPAENNIYIQLQELNTNKIKIDIYNTSGQLIKSNPAISINGSISFAISDLEDGNYLFLQLIMEKENRQSIS